MRHYLIALAAAFVAATMGPASAQAQLPPNLQGETFVDAGSIGVPSNCPATLSFGGDGPAFGPYSGAFAESGTFTITGGLVTAFESTFSIDSLTGQVTGTKRLLLGGAGNCRFSSIGRGSAVDASALLTYEATIKPPTGGTFRDTGQALVFFTGRCFLASCRTSLVENFTLSQGVLPVDTTGKATGGGQLAGIAEPDHVTFGFEVKQPELGRLQGRCLVIDSAADTQVKCLDVTSYGQFGNTATWTGNATVNGSPETYRIIVQDNGEPNQGIDTFSIKTQSYEAAGAVEHGNVQIHKQPT